MTASLPQEIQQVFDTFVTTEFATVDRRGQPICWPLTPYYRPGDLCIDVSTALGYPKKAFDAQANPKVALLFSDPTGSGLDDAPQVLVQGIADVDYEDLEANRERYGQESLEKLPGAKSLYPPAFLQRAMSFYFTRIYIHVRPERVYVWPGGDPTGEPTLYDAHMEEVRSGHDEEPDAPHAPARGGATVWDKRMDELGERYQHAVLSLVAPDGFPFSLRVPISVDVGSKRVRIGARVVGLPVQPGLACLTAHDHHPEFKWQRNFQVRGDLVEEDGGWVLLPHKMVGGLELPPVSKGKLYAQNARKMSRMWRTARKTKRRLRA
ncbi:MAG TPA: pyridoxamine 5'-phosphate oxidase family protein [Thermoleophilaceae bacterium]|nr:pyridoxamine 5'-phosphate oxidase family protein [Thermoleophilaceae bacterium]